MEGIGLGSDPMGMLIWIFSALMKKCDEDGCDLIKFSLLIRVAGDLPTL